MSEQKVVMVYGSMPRSPEDVLAAQQRMVTYLDALIETYYLNPTDDWENERRLKVMAEIATSDLPDYMRIKLVNKLNLTDTE